MATLKKDASTQSTKPRKLSKMKSEGEIRAEVTQLKNQESQVQTLIDAKMKEGKDEDGTKLLMRKKLLVVTKRETLEWALNERLK